MALARLEQGNLSNVKTRAKASSNTGSIGDRDIGCISGGMAEALVIPLTGGTKHRQQRDIKTAKMSWNDYKRRPPRVR